MSKSFLHEAARAVRHHKHELTEDGRVHLPGSRVFIGGMFTARYQPPGGPVGEPIRGARCVYPNRVVGQGLNKILNLLAGHATSAALYLAPFSGNVTPAASWTGANWVGLATEFTTYTPATRVPWTTVPATAAELTNSAALAAATITFAAGGPYTIRGCALAEASAKSATTGALIAASRFDADLAGMIAGGKLALQYDLVAVDEADA